jgi:hemerythrin
MKILTAVNAVMDACSQGRNSPTLEQAVNFLSDYTKSHFTHEEELQLEHKFPGYEEHRAWHQGFYEAFKKVNDKFLTEGSTKALTDEVNAKFSILLEHIRTMDVSLARYIQKNA